jgi:uncharacterized repeat protein (TIGR01451 family)
MRHASAFMFAWLTLNGTAYAQIVQNFEDNPEKDPLLIEQCFVGEAVRVDSQGAIEGEQQLSAGPLNKNKVSFYRTPFLNISSAATFSFKHKAEDAGNQGLPQIFVDLLDTHDAVVATLYSLQYVKVQEVISTTLPFGRDGVYRVQWRFTGNNGNDRVALDQLLLYATSASEAYPACGPVIPVNQPPVARPDAGFAPAGATAVVDVLANDSDPDGELDPATVDLEPHDSSSTSHEREIRNAAGELIGRAEADLLGHVSVSPVAGFTGALVVPYSVRDDQGARSNTTVLIVAIAAPRADLALSLNGPASAVSGDEVTYVATVLNRGPDAVAEATLTFSTSGPIDALGVICSVGRQGCAPAVITGGTASVALNGLEPGGALTMRLTGTATGPGTITVRADVAPAAPTVDPDPANNSATVATAVVAAVVGADLVIGMTGPDEILPDAVASYTITVTNEGPDPASAVQVTSAGPTGFVFEGATGACTALPCSLGMLSTGGMATFTARYRLPLPPGVTIVPVPPVTNRAMVSSATPDPDPGSNTASVSTAILTDVDVAISVGATFVEVPLGQTASIVFTAGNAGPNPARNVVVRLTAPPQVTLDSFETTGGTFNPATGVWQIPEIGVDSQEELTLVVGATAVGEFLLRARVDPPPTDSDSTNDEALSSLHVGPSADVGTRLSANTTAPVIGSPTTVTVLAGNLGPTASSAASVRVELPAGVRLVSATPSGGTFNPATGIWTLGALAPATLFTMPMVVVVETAAQVVVTAAASAATFDPNSANNAHALALNASSSADLVFTLTASTPSPVVGQTVSIHAEVTNGGPSPATDTVVNFTGSPGLTPISATVSVGAITGPAQWTIGTLASGATAFLDAVIRIDAPGPLSLSGVAGTSATDPDTSNNSAQVAFNSVPDPGTVAMDFEDLTGTETCWVWPGMAPGGLTAAGEPFGRTQANPPLQALVHLVSSQMSGGTNTVRSPWIQMYGAGEIRFVTKLTNRTSAPVVRVSLEEVATGTMTLVFEKTYTAIDPVYDAVPIAVTGIYRVRWTFTGAGGSSRAAIDDITITGTQATAGIGQPGLPVSPYDCRPIIPGNTPPQARPDFVTTPVDTPASVAILANDTDADGTLNPASVNLDPLASADRVTSRDVKRLDGVVLGRAVVDAAGVLSFTPAPGLSGAGAVPYTVDDDRGGVSNVSVVTFAVGASANDLGVAISGPDVLAPASAATYTVELRNQGPGASIPASFQLSYPGVTLISVTCRVVGGPAACGAGTITGTDFTTTLPGIGAGAVVEYTVNAIMPPSFAVVTLSASAAVVPPATELNPADNAATHQTVVGTPPSPARADVLVAVAGPDLVPLGSTAAYLVFVQNRGPSQADAVVLAVTPPAGFILVSALGACPSAPPCQLGALPPGAGRTTVLTYRVAGGFPTATLTAVVSSSTRDPVPGNNRSVAVTDVVREYDLAALVTGAPVAAPIGGIVNAALTVSNAGPALAEGVVADVQLSPGLAFVRQSSTRGSFDPATGRWAIGSLAANEIAELRLTLRVEVPGPLSAGLTISGGLAFDTDETNNSAAIDLMGLPSADISLLQTVDDDAPSAGQAIVLTLAAANAGPSDSTNVEIQTALPEGLVLQASSPSAGTFNPATGVWSIGPMTAGAGATLVQTVLVARDGTFTTSAVVSETGAFDPDLSNNSTGVTLNAGPVSDLGVSIRAPEMADVGDQVDLRVTVQNAGPSDTTGVLVRGVIPAGLHVIETRPSVGVIDDKGRWSVGSLAVGADATLDLTAEVTAAGALTGEALVTHDNPDPNLVNNRASATINAGSLADVRVTAIATTPVALVSDNVTVVVAVTNEGPATSSPVEVDVGIAPPPAMTLISARTATGAFNPATGRWSVGRVPAGESKLLILVVRIGDPGTLPVVARLVPGIGGDPNPGNDQSGAFVEVPESFRTVADLSLELVSPGSIQAGGAATLMARAFNAGSTYAIDLTIDLDVAAGLDVVSVVPTFGGSCPVVPPPGAGGAVRCVWPGQSVVGRGRPREVALTLHAPAGAAPGSRATVSGRVSSLTVDRFPHNNAALAAIAIADATLPDVSIAKAVLPAGGAEISAAVGCEVRYRISLQNHGPAAASDVRVADQIAPLLQLLSATPSQGSLAGGLWHAGTIAPGASASLDVVAMVVNAGRANLAAVVTSGAPGDGNAANDSSSIVLDARGEGAGSRFVAAGNVNAVGDQEIITGSGTGEPGQVRIFDGQGRALARFYAYDPHFQGGVRVAACDIDGDGRDEIVTGAGNPGGGPHVRIFQAFGERIVEVNSFYSDGEAYRGGIYVACGDVTGDGRPEVITGTGTIGPGTIRVWDTGLFSFTEIAAWQAFNTPEARVAVCDVDADGQGDVLATSGPGSAATLKGFTGAGGLLGSLTVLGGAVSGGFVACGDVMPATTGPEIVVSADAGGAPLLEMYSTSGTLVARVLADEAGARGGVRVAVGDVDGAAPGHELIVGSGANREPRVRLGSAGFGSLVELRTFVAPNLP